MTALMARLLIIKICTNKIILVIIKMLFQEKHLHFIHNKKKG